jgi:hypothetical protein
MIFILQMNRNLIRGHGMVSIDALPGFLSLPAKPNTSDADLRTA